MTTLFGDATMTSQLITGDDVVSSTSDVMQCAVDSKRCLNELGKLLSLPGVKPLYTTVIHEQSF